MIKLARESVMSWGFEGVFNGVSKAGGSFGDFQHSTKHLVSIHTYGWEIQNVERLPTVSTSSAQFVPLHPVCPRFDFFWRAGTISPGPDFSCDEQSTQGRLAPPALWVFEKSQEPQLQQIPGVSQNPIFRKQGTSRFFDRRNSRVVRKGSEAKTKLHWKVESWALSSAKVIQMICCLIGKSFDQRAAKYFTKWQVKRLASIGLDSTDQTPDRGVAIHDTRNHMQTTTTPLSHTTHSITILHRPPTNRTAQENPDSELFRRTEVIKIRTLV